jgi:hypothetical protein
MRYLYVLILFFLSHLVIGQNTFHIGGQLGYTMNEGPLEKYQGINIGVFIKYKINKIFFQTGYDHITGVPNYGQYYSKELPNVPVYDIYDENYGLAIYPSDDFSEVKVGVHQFDPSYGKYVARQFSLGFGYSIPFHIKKLNFEFCPTVLGLYRHVNENFVYGVKEIKIEDSFQSNNFVSVNHLIFAYLRYSNIGYQISLPLNIGLNDKTSLTTSLIFNSNIKAYNSYSFNIGISTKIR